MRRRFFSLETAPVLGRQLSRQRARQSRSPYAGTPALPSTSSRMRRPIRQYSSVRPTLTATAAVLARLDDQLLDVAQQTGGVSSDQPGRRRGVRLADHGDSCGARRLTILRVLACFSRSARSARIRSSSTLAGSSLGSCGTSCPEKAARRMFWRWAADCLSAVSIAACLLADRFNVPQLGEPSRLHFVPTAATEIEIRSTMDLFNAARCCACTRRVLSTASH